MSAAKDAATAAMQKHGLSIRAEFIPFSRSRSKDEKETNSDGKQSTRPRLSLNWRVTLLKEAREILTTDYGAGIAHCPGYKPQEGDTRGGYERNQRVVWECEHGRAARYRSWGVGAVTGGAPILPDSVDVLYSLLMDSHVLDAGGFEEWAREYGYDTDSRKAETIYRACLELALKLRSGLGETLLAELREAFAGY